MFGCLDGGGFERGREERITKIYRIEESLGSLELKAGKKHATTL